MLIRNFGREAGDGGLRDDAAGDAGAAIAFRRLVEAPVPPASAVPSPPARPAAVRPIIDGPRRIIPPISPAGPAATPPPRPVLRPIIGGPRRIVSPAPSAGPAAATSYQSRLDGALAALNQRFGVDYGAKDCLQVEDDQTHKVNALLDLLAQQGSIAPDEQRWLGQSYRDFQQTIEHQHSRTGYAHLAIAPPSGAGVAGFALAGGQGFRPIDLTPRVPSPTMNASGNPWVDAALQSAVRQWIAEPAGQRGPVDTYAWSQGLEGDKYLVHVAAEGTYSLLHFDGSDSQEAAAADRADTSRGTLERERASGRTGPLHDGFSIGQQQYLVTLHADGRFDFVPSSNGDVARAVSDAVDALTAQMQATPAAARHDLSQRIAGDKGTQYLVTVHPDGRVTETETQQKKHGGGFFGFLGSILPIIDIASFFIPVLAPVAGVLNAISGAQQLSQGNILGGIAGLTGSAAGLLKGATAAAGMLGDISKASGELSSAIHAVQSGSVAGLLESAGAIAGDATSLAKNAAGTRIAGGLVGIVGAANTLAGPGQGLGGFLNGAAALANAGASAERLAGAKDKTNSDPGRGFAETADVLNAGANLLVGLGGGATIAASNGDAAPQLNEAQKQELARLNQALGYAKLCDLNYHDVSKATLSGFGYHELPPETWASSGSKVGALVHPGADALTDGSSGFVARVFQDDAGKVVVAFRGTESTKDFGADGRLFVGWNSAQLKETVDVALAAKALFGAGVTFIGDSKGGGQAAIAALATESKAVTFNAAPVNDVELSHVNDALGKVVLTPFATGPGAAGPKAAQLVTDYEVNGQVLQWIDNLSLATPLGQQPLGTRIDLPAGPKSHDPIARHKMAGVIEALNDRMNAVLHPPAPLHPQPRPGPAPHLPGTPDYSTISSDFDPANDGWHEVSTAAPPPGR